MTFISESLQPAITAALCLLIEAVQDARQLHTLHLGIATAHDIRSGPEIRALLLRVFAAASTRLLKHPSLRCVATAYEHVHHLHA